MWTRLYTEARPTRTRGKPRPRQAVVNPDPSSAIDPMITVVCDVKDVLNQLRSWREKGEDVALATVVGTRGSAPRPSGARLGLTRSGAMIGSLSGGCVEGDVFERALRVLDEERPEIASYGPVEPESFEVGLSCDGTIDVVIEPFEDDEVWSSLAAAIAEDRPCALGLAISPGEALARRLGVVLGHDGRRRRIGSIAPDLDEAIADEAIALLERRGKRVLELERDGDPLRVFIEVFTPPQRLYVVGATHIAIPLCRMASEVGFRVSVIDPRTAFATRERFADAHEVIREWPVDVLDGVELGEDAYVLTLTHDPKFDLPTLARALSSNVRYIGALGSRGTHAKRLGALRDQGFSDDALSRIRTPVGLDLGARTPEEIALAILAEMVAVRNDASLADRPGSRASRAGKEG